MVRRQDKVGHRSTHKVLEWKKKITAVFQSILGLLCKKKKKKKEEEKDRFVSTVNSLKANKRTNKTKNKQTNIETALTANVLKTKTHTHKKKTTTHK